MDIQHGFRSGRSCESQLITAREEIAAWRDKGHNVDVLIMDFSKAFDKVPHQRLLSKLEHYGVTGSLWNWIQNWLTTRTQTVVLEGMASQPVKVKSGVPQGTVLGPLMFLLYINDITDDIKHSSVQLFADDCLLYRVVDTEEDERKLQRDLFELELWSNKWQLDFNIKKCHQLCVRKKGHEITSEYTLKGKTLKPGEHHPCLGVEWQSNMKWDQHIHQITAKANRSLGFLRGNLSKCPEIVKEGGLSSTCASSRRIRFSGMGSLPHQGREES